MHISKKGFAPILLILLAALGIIIYLLISSSAPFKDKLFSLLYPKPSSYAYTEVSINGLKVQGNQIVNSDNQIVKLYGVNRSGTEFACVQGWGIFDGPNDAASVDAIKGWKVNAVRIPLNENCWLGINGVKSEYAGGNYQQAIVNYVNLLNSKGLAAILELHWSASGTQAATGQQPMPNRDHTPAFWTSVASTFKNNSSVLFDLFNEPFPDNNQDSFAAWTCWRDGGTCSGMPFQAAGMQELINAVRGTGAANIIMLGGVQYSNAMSKWLTFKPTDSGNNLAASWHVYNFNACNSSSCWDTNVAPVIASVPLITTELGENDCAHSFIDPLMNWLDSKGVGYLAWTWNTWDCKGGPSLISNYDGTPTSYGVGFKDHLAQIVSGPSLTPSPTATSSATLSPTPTSTSTPTSSPTSISDTTAPSVLITNPVNGSSVKANSKINITASVSDNVAVSKVEFYVNNTLRCSTTLSFSPYSCSWSIPGKKRVSYTILVKGYDTSNNVNSASVKISSF